MSKLFVVSDIHGHYTELSKALEKAGFDQNSKDHIFVSCGDLFDKGDENNQVYQFVKGLQRKILIKGNHEDIMHESLVEGGLTELAIQNETDFSLRQILGQDAICEDGSFNGDYKNEIDQLILFIESMPDYYETDKYVFNLIVHAHRNCKPELTHTYHTDK